MKRTSLANRGRPFEDLLNLAHSRYQASGTACVHKVPTEFIPLRDGSGKLVSCKVEHKSCVDYLGRYRNIPVAIEAKHTEDKRIRFDRVEAHQAEYLDDFCKYPGTIGLVVVSYGMKRFFAVPWPAWKAWSAECKATPPRARPIPVTVKYCGDFWDTPARNSVAADDLPAKWEINLGGPYALPYLQIIERLAWREKINGKD